MRAMKDSGIEWIGQIPQEWNTIRAKYVTTITNGSDPKTEGNTPVYGSGSGCFKTCGEYKEGPTVLLGRKGTVDIPQYITGNYWNVDTAFDVKTAEEQLDLEFYYFAATCFDYKYYTATTTLPSMTQTNYGNMYIPFPPVDVQRCVVAGIKEKLVGIDALIAAKEKTNALLKERRQSIIYEAVTKGLNPEAPMKDSGIEWIGEIPEHWKVERLKPHIDFNPKTAIPEYGEEDSVSFIPMDCLRRGVHTSQTVDYSKVKSGYVDFAEGDILMAKVTPCLENGNLAIAGNLIDGVGFGSTEINVIRCKSIHREYLFYILQCKTYVDRAVADMYGVAGLKRLNPSFIPNTKYPMPSIEEQQGIAEHLASTCSEIDELVAANERTIEKLKEYRQSTIYEAVTGKIEV